MEKKKERKRERKKERKKENILKTMLSWMWSGPEQQWLECFVMLSLGSWILCIKVLFFKFIVSMYALKHLQH